LPFTNVLGGFGQVSIGCVDLLVHITLPYESVGQLLLEKFQPLGRPASLQCFIGFIDRYASCGRYTASPFLEYRSVNRRVVIGKIAGGAIV